MKNLSPIPLAIAGCGFAARQIHAPRLLSSPNLFKVVAVCDPIPQAAQTVSVMFGGVPVFSEVEAMLAHSKPEALAVLSTHHAEPLKAGLANDLDIFVEKPFCETLEDGNEIKRMAEEKKRVVMVGAMRVFDPAIEYVRSLLASIAPILWVEMHDFIGQALSAGSSSGGMVAKRFQAGLPLSEGRPRNTLQTLLLMFIHDISILRGLFDGPISCDDAKIAQDGWSITGRLILPGAIPCLFGVCEYGLLKLNHFEENIQIIGENGILRLNFGDSNTPGGGLTTVQQATVGSKDFIADSYSLEWQAFHHAIATRVTERNSAKDGLADLSLAWDIANIGLKEK